MKDRSVPHVNLTGTPYEIGFEHGNLLADQIHSQIGIYRVLFMERCSFDWSRVLELAGEFREAIQKLAPDLLQEMQGIADGMKDEAVGLLDIVALNARSEIMLGQWSDGCTSIGWRVPGADKQFLAQNWDMDVEFGQNLAMASIVQPGKPKIWMVIEPGIVGKIGFNSSNVGVCLNAIRASPTFTSLLPVHVLLRIALECDSVAVAMRTFEKLGGCASSQHILISDLTSGSQGLELSPLGTISLKEDRHGIVLHTNHFLENTLVDRPRWRKDSVVRLGRARQLCDDIIAEGVSGEKVTPSFLRQRLFSDNYDFPRAICCAQDPSQGLRDETLFNIVMVFSTVSPPMAEVVFGRPGSENQSQVYYMPWN